MLCGAPVLYTTSCLACVCAHFGSCVRGCRERHEGLAARTKSLAAGTHRRALVAVAADSQVAVMDAETGFTLSK
jgi:hypothetical protein